MEFDPAIMLLGAVVILLVAILLGVVYAARDQLELAGGRRRSRPSGRGASGEQQGRREWENLAAHCCPPRQRDGPENTHGGTSILSVASTLFFRSV
jgi:hypothetical protein